MSDLARKIKRVCIVFCCLFTLVVGVFVLTNISSILKMTSVVGLIRGNFLGESSTDAMFEGATAGIVSSLGDKYSVYYSREKTRELYESVQGIFGGIGIYVPDSEERTVVSALVEGGPSERAGLLAGDIIISVDDEDVSTLSSEQVVSKLRGDIGTQVAVSVLREADQKVYDFAIVREAMDETSAQAALLKDYPEIAYLHISKFATNTDEEVLKALNDLIKAGGFKGLIVDLRNNGGGDVEAAVNIAGLFVPAGPVVHIVDKAGHYDTRTSSGPQITVPLVVLVNEYSASASEIFAGAIKDTQAGTLVGTTTYGKGVVQVIYPLRDGSSVKLTQSRYLTPNKNDINQVGITPDVYCDFPEDMTVDNFEDVQLDKAIEILQDKM